MTLDIAQASLPFEKLQVGDVVSVEYYDRVIVRPHPAGDPPIDRTEPRATNPSPGALPGATSTGQRTTTVTITAWDPATRLVTFTIPSGATFARHLADNTDPALLSSLKVGDRVDAIRTEAARLTVESRTTVQVEATEDFRHRFTLSLLWGVDNTFAGKMIKEATGQTTTGQVIRLQETSYDDVYGRMGILKIGAGYRITPRDEGVFNLVISRSSSEVVNIGTVGANNTPLYVNFDDYNYWGLEAGQRFYFARTRFTPYVGYLLGLNRNGDIRGTFVDVPASATPGLAAQDGKFFEKSWALSFGPTAGVLVGVGPIELMAETQFRFMNGLSDVDWLVEEGLRDINSESTRWSLPVQVGVRIRF